MRKEKGINKAQLLKIKYVEDTINILQIHAGHYSSYSKELDENFQAWLVSKSFTPQQAEYLSLLKSRAIAFGGIKMDDLFQPPLLTMYAAAKGIGLFGESGLKEII